MGVQSTSVTIERITPAIAAAYLTMNVNNRKIRDGRVAQYAAAMSAGEWVMTGEPIIFNGSSLANGQHRLLACVASNTPFETVVVRGVPDTAFAVIDSGVPRSMGDVFALEHIPNSNQTAATARIVMTYRAGMMGDPYGSQQVASRPKMLEEVAANRDLYSEAVRTWGSERARDAGLNRTACSAFFILAGANEAVADFLSATFTGANLEINDPRLTVRNWANASRVRTAPMHLSGLIRAWNALERSEPLKLIRPWLRGTPFPRIEGQANDEATSDIEAA
jgi:hypothetical protein